MNKEEIVQLLQYRRHALVNDIQVIHAYAAMNMFDKVQEKLDEFIKETNNEQKLHMLAAPAFILWIEQFQMNNQDFDLSYDVQDMLNLEPVDEWITSQCEKLMKEVKNVQTIEQLSTMHLRIFKDVRRRDCIELSVSPFDEAVFDQMQSSREVHGHARMTCSYENGQLIGMIQIDGLIEGE